MLFLLIVIFHPGISSFGVLSSAIFPHTLFEYSWNLYERHLKHIAFLFSAQINGGKIMICDAFFLQILPKIHFISTPWSEVDFTYCFPNPGWCSIVSCFPASRSWVRSYPSPYFFCNKRVAENFPVLSGRLVW